MEKHKKYMQIALDEAACGAKNNCVPIGCIIVHENQIIAQTHNEDFWHAEILCIQIAQKKLGKYLSNTIMFITVEPCPMCLHAIRLARIPCVFFAAHNNLEPLPQTELINGPYEEEAKMLMQNFFKEQRQKNQK